MYPPRSQSFLLFLSSFRPVSALLLSSSLLFPNISGLYNCLSVYVEFLCCPCPLSVHYLSSYYPGPLLLKACLCLVISVISLSFQGCCFVSFFYSSTLFFSGELHSPFCSRFKNNFCALSLGTDKTIGQIWPVDELSFIISLKKKKNQNCHFQNVSDNTSWQLHWQPGLISK